jgi:ATP-dependent Clp protease ATP-binding subunit ClpA
MFERFTASARRVVVLAQEEARTLQHNYIGTEHLLLGLLRESDSVAARALARFEITLDGTQLEIRELVGPGKQELKGHIPFTPRAKKVLELGLREAVALHHSYIGTEHLLLGLIREGSGVGAQILKEHAGDLAAVRLAVLDLLPTSPPEPSRRWRRRWATRWAGLADEPSPEAEPEQDQMRTTPAAEASLDEAARLAGPHAVGSHHLLLAALADPDAAASRALAGLGVDLDQARMALRDADVAGTSDEFPEDAGRRRMMIRVSETSLTLEASDPLLVGLGQAALHAVGQDVVAISGDLAVSASLGTVWEALRDSLEDIRRRAGARPGDDEPGQAGAGQQ